MASTAVRGRSVHGTKALEICRDDPHSRGRDEVRGETLWYEGIRAGLLIKMATVRGCCYTTGHPRVPWSIRMGGASVGNILAEPWPAGTDCGRSPENIRAGTPVVGRAAPVRQLPPGIAG